MIDILVFGIVICGIVLIVFGLIHFYRGKKSAGNHADIALGDCGIKNVPFGMLLIILGVACFYFATKMLQPPENSVKVYVSQSSNGRISVPEIVIPEKSGAKESFTTTASLKEKMGQALDKPKYARIIKINDEPAKLNIDSINVSRRIDGDYYFSANIYSKSKKGVVVFSAKNTNDLLQFTPTEIRVNK